MGPFDFNSGTGAIRIVSFVSLVSLESSVLVVIVPAAWQQGPE